MIDIDPNTHINGWYRDWLPRASTHELKRLLTTPYGQDPKVGWRLEAELARRDQQSRPEPSPGRPKPIPRGVRANAVAPPADNLAAKIVLAGKKARGEIESTDEPKGLAAQIIAAGRKRRGESK
jgi:hypothetical protein